MSADQVDIAQLSESERDALETYTNVTGQNLVEAIPLLRRSQWNVQIAISKFFDGEGPDPVEESHAALNHTPLTQPPRRTQNLMYDDDYSIRQRSSSSPRDLEPAPRIATQPEDQGPSRPPFLLAFFFVPLNLLYRFIYSSFRLFGALFPFLPSFLNVTSNTTIQSLRRNTSGRRALSPKDTAGRFIREFEEEYGSHSLPFLENGYNMALEKAHRELKFLVVVLLSPEHDHTNYWVKDTLLSREVSEFMTDQQNDILLWGGSVQDSEAYQVANSLRCTKFPFVSVIIHTPNVNSAAMSTIARIPGNISSSEFISKLRVAINQNKESLSQVRAGRVEQEASRNLREAQDSAYQLSLAQDRERTRQRREAEAVKQQAEQAEAQRKAAAEKRIRDLQQWKQWRAHSLPNEPGLDIKDSIRISVRFTSGERVIRKFASNTDLEELYAFVECYDVLQRGVQDSSQTSVVGEPEGFEHKYRFRLVSPMPRVVYDVELGGSIRERIGHGGNLIVELIEGDDEEE